MTREELVQWQRNLLLGIPPYSKNVLGELLRNSGTPGIHERRQMGNFDANASGVLLALEGCLAVCQHALDNLPLGKDE